MGGGESSAQDTSNQPSQTILADGGEGLQSKNTAEIRRRMRTAMSEGLGGKGALGGSIWAARNSNIQGYGGSRTIAEDERMKKEAEFNISGGG